MADEKNSIDKTTEKLGTFETIVKETGQEITKLIPTLNTFFAAFGGAKIAAAGKQMLDFYQGFKNLSFQMGKSNTMSKEFLKNIYKVKSATGDTLENLNEITATLVKSRVEGGKSLEFLTKQVSYFAEATGAGVDTSSQLAGNLHRIGHLGPKSISSIMTSMLKTQRTFGLTSEEVVGLSQNIIETTTQLSNLGKTSSFIENFQQGTIKLAAAFRQVGLEASEATDIVDRLLDIDRLEENMLLYSKMGISIQDAVAGNIDPNMMTSRLQEVGQQIASMSRPAGAALARQMGISYRQALQFQNLKPTEDVKNEENDMEKMVREQRTLWTKIEKGLNSGLGAIASKFLQNPLMFTSFIVGVWFLVGKKVFGFLKRKYFAIADEVGDKFKKVLTDAFKEAADQGIEKSNVVKGMKENQGLKPGRGYNGRDVLAAYNAKKENAQKWLGNEGIVGYQKALNAQAAFGAESSARRQLLVNAQNELQARKTYLEREDRDLKGSEKSELNYITKQLRIFEKELKSIDTNTNETNLKLQNDVTNAIKKMTPAEKVAEINRLNEERKNKLDEYQRLQAQANEQNRLRGIIAQKRGTMHLNTAKPSELNDYFALGDRESQLQGVVDELQKKMEALNTEIEQLTESSKTLEEKWAEAGGGSDTDTKQLFMGPIQKMGLAIKRGFSSVWSSLTKKVKSLTTGEDGKFSMGKTLGSILKGGFGLIKRLLLPMGLAMAGMTIVSKVMQRFEPLFEMLAPAIEGIFDAVATIVAPLIKWTMKPILHILKGIYGMIRLIPWVKDRTAEIDFDKILKNIDSWEVGKKMDDQAKAEEENAVLMEMQNGSWTAKNPNRAEDFWAGSGFGKQTKKILDKMDEILDASRATVGAIDNQTEETRQSMFSEGVRGRWKWQKSLQNNKATPDSIAAWGATHQ